MQGEGYTGAVYGEPALKGLATDQGSGEKGEQVENAGAAQHDDTDPGQR